MGDLKVGRGGKGFGYQATPVLAPAFSACCLKCWPRFWSMLLASDTGFFFFFFLFQASKECQVLYARLGLVQLFAIWLQLVMLRPLVASLLPLRESVSTLAVSSVAREEG